MNNTISIEVLAGSILELTFYKKFEFEIVNIKTGRMPVNEEFSVSVNDLRSRVHVRGRQAVQTEIGFLFMSMNLTKLAKNLALKTSDIQKPHSDSFNLIGFKTEIVVWFYFKASFGPTSFCVD